MQAIWNDIVIAESDDTVVVEGNHYFPFDSIKEEYYSKTELTTFCGWKGMANLAYLQEELELIVMVMCL
jgi:uncharacterized protein (DUF427 family)